MDTHLFGLGDGAIDEEDRDRVAEIAEAHEARFVTVTMPGEGPRFWFETRHMGEAANERKARSLLDDLERAGLHAVLWP